MFCVNVCSFVRGMLCWWLMVCFGCCWILNRIRWFFLMVVLVWCSGCWIILSVLFCMVLYFGVISSWLVICCGSCCGCCCGSGGSSLYIGRIWMYGCSGMCGLCCCVGLIFVCLVISMIVFGCVCCCLSVFVVWMSVVICWICWLR